jgi:pimeloyl-ACP methyl ester carboxylesterase
LQQLIAGSKLVRFDGAGHYVHEEAAAGVAAAITDWLSEVDPAR